MNLNSHHQRILKNGWLLKQGGMIKSWHKRWFVLNGDWLFYFAKHDDIKALGSIFLPGNRVCQLPFNADEPERFTFQILPGKGNARMAPNHESYILVADSEDERQSWIKVIRKVMYSSKGGAIFGQSIAETMKFEHERGRKIPFIIEQCVEFLRQHGLETEGIFRLPGRAALARELKEKYDSAERYKLDDAEVDIHTVASLLKMYLRELPESIIPASLFQKYMNIALKYQSAKTEQEKLEIVYSLQTAMPDLQEDNYNILKYLCQFLYDVASHSSSNKMDAMNLATIFGPNIIRHLDDNPELFMATADITHQLSFMTIEYYDKVFTYLHEHHQKPTGGTISVVAVDDLLGLGTGSESLQEPMSPVSGDFEILTIADREQKNLNDGSDSSSSNSLSKSQSSLGQSLIDDLTESLQKKELTEKKSGCSGSFTPDGRPIPPKRPSKIKRGLRVSSRSSKSSSTSEPTTPDSSQKSTLDRSDSTNNGVFENTNGNDKGENSGVRTNVNSNNVNPSGKESDIPVHCNCKTRQYSPQTSTDCADDKSSSSFDSKVAPSSAQMHLNIAALKDELSRNKSKYEMQINALKGELTNLREKYEEQIRVLNIQHDRQLNSLRLKLEEEQLSRSEAVNRIVLLQKQLHEYDMRYGELS